MAKRTRLTTSDKGIALIKRFEGLRLTAYRCAAGVWTIGWGHTKGVRKGMKISKAAAESYLRQDLTCFERYVNSSRYVPFQPTQAQFDALVSFAFNCGAGNLRTLCKGRTARQVTDAMLLYRKAGGKVNAGLVERRRAERALFLGGEKHIGGVTKKIQEEHNMDTLKKGDKGQQVRCLQKLMGGIAVDGVFGAKTEDAVKAWQRLHKLTVDGVVGPKTWAAILS